MRNRYAGRLYGSPETGLFKICTTCGAKKPLDDFYANKLGVGGKKAVCKACESKQVSVRNILRRARKDPDNHMGCNDCDRVFDKYYSSYREGMKDRWLVMGCKFCGSKNIENFSGGIK